MPNATSPSIPAVPALRLEPRRRLATGPVPAALILAGWALLCVWFALGVVRPLSRSMAPERAVAEARGSIRA